MNKNISAKSFRSHVLVPNLETGIYIPKVKGYSTHGTASHSFNTVVLKGFEEKFVFCNV